MEKPKLDNYKYAQEILEKSLIGNFYCEINVGDWWALSFSNDIWLVAQELVSSEEDNINQHLMNANPPVLDGVDPEYISKGIVVLRNMRQEVSRVLLFNDGSLKLFFENQWELTFPSTENTVDWQWCLSRSGKDPFHDFIVACFFENEIQRGMS